MATPGQRQKSGPPQSPHPSGRPPTDLCSRDADVTHPVLLPVHNAPMRHSSLAFLAFLPALILVAGTTRGSGDRPIEARLPKPPESILIVEGQTHRSRVDPVTGTATRIEAAVDPERPNRPAASSEGWSATVEVEGRGAASHHVLVIGRPSSDARGVVDPATLRQGPRRLALPGSSVVELAWAPGGGTLLLCRTVGGASTIDTLDATRDDSEPERISPADAVARHPAIAADGTIAYALLRERRGKDAIFDVILREKDGAERIVLDRSSVRGLALSADGRTLAIGLQGEVRLIDLAGGAAAGGNVRRSWNLSEIDARAAAHHPSGLAFSPEGRFLAARVPFSGGRSTGFGEPEEVEENWIFGDRELLVIDLAAPDGAAAARIITLDEPTRRLAWQ